MKIHPIIYKLMFAAMKAVVENLGGAAKVNADLQDQIKKQGSNPHKTSIGNIWNIWHSASDNLMYSDAHPLFQNGKWTRVYPQHPGFDPYAAGNVNDNHIETALKAIAKELGIDILP